MVVISTSYRKVPSWTRPASFNGFVSGIPVFRVEIDDGGIGNGFFTLDDLQATVVPAPGVLPLLGLAGLMGARRRRR